MPRQPRGTEDHMKNLIACLEPAIALLQEVQDAFATPFVQAILNTTISLATAIQNVKKNKDKCIQLTEQVHQVLYALVDLHVKSETPGSLPPATLDHVGKFMETMHKICTFIEAQQGGNRIKSFFRQSEITSLLKDCQIGMQYALTVFKIESGTPIVSNIREMHMAAEKLQEELLELISSFSCGTTSDRASSMYQTLNSSHLSSRSFAMLPAKPKIFHGRELELTKIIQMFTQDYVHVSILGAGGMGKSSLAKAILHHPDITAKYQDRFFVPCDAASTSTEIVALIGAHIGLKPGKDLTKPIIQYFSGQPVSFLILDNLETAWEPLASRNSVEELLSLLTDINNLALLITMRGAERPAKVRWNRPFLPPLEPLSTEAARNIFMDIADDVHDTKEVDQLLQLTDNMPLAVHLIAHLVDHNDCASVLARWDTEKTSLLSTGYDHRSNLDASIAISLSSPRLMSLPGAKDLLSLLSILPDGLSDIELLQAKLPIENILACKARLLGTALAFNDDKKRLKSLVPIREHMQCFYPVKPYLVQPLEKYFHALLHIYRKYGGSQHVVGEINQITLNFGNLNQVLLHGLQHQNPELAETIRCAMSLNHFSVLFGHGWHALMHKIPHVFPQPCDHRLETEFIVEVLTSSPHHTIVDPELFVSRAESHFEHFEDPILESQVYRAAGYLHAFAYRTNVQRGIELLEKALAQAKYGQDLKQQAHLLSHMTSVKWNLGDYSEGQLLAKEAQRLAKLCTNLYEEARALRAEAMCCHCLGDYKSSISQLHRARDLLYLCGMSEGQLYHGIMNDEAEVHMLKTEYPEARAIHLQLSQSTSAEHDRSYHAYSLLNLGQIDAETSGMQDAAHCKIEQAKTLFKSIQDPDGVNCCQTIIAEILLGKGELATAKVIFENCLQQSWLENAQASDYCLERMADIVRWDSVNFEWSFMHAAVYLAFSKKILSQLGLYKALRCIGNVLLAHGDEATAESVLIVALDGFTHMDVHRCRADCMLYLGGIAKRQGNFARAVALWKQARPLFERSLRAESVAYIDVELADLAI